MRALRLIGLVQRKALAIARDHVDRRASCSANGEVTAPGDVAEGERHLLSDVWLLDVGVVVAK